jgi:hypothetical protein
MQIRTAFIGLALFITACKEDGVGNESPCQKVCRRVGEAEAACAPATCVEDCEAELPACDAENRAYVACLADAQLLGCLDHSEPVALGECEAQQSELSTCLENDEGSESSESGDESTSAPEDSSGSASASEEGSGGSEESGSGPCDPLAADCVACGEASCGETCCWSDAPTCAASCEAVPSSTCDGAEDCAGAQCCVEMSVSGTDATVDAGTATCTGEGGSTCCAPTPGVMGCDAEPSVESCVCAIDDYCCTTEWDAQCVAYVEQLSCGTCASGCDVTNGSTGTGSFIRSLACRTSADCAGVVGEFGVPYGMCCAGTNFGVAACVSETYGYAIMDAGGTCS